MRLLAALCVSYSLLASAPALAQSFQGLGDFAGGPFSSTANAVSADGSVVVGSGNSADGLRGFRWAGGGLSELETLGGDYSIADGVSPDGSVPVGRSERGSGGVLATRWLGGDARLVGVRTLSARDASAGGTYIVGHALSGGVVEAYRWTSGAAEVLLGDLPGGSHRSEAHAASSDGSVVVGYSSSEGGLQAFRWEGSMVGLGFLEGGTSSNALGVSADGTIVVGSASSAVAASQGFKWTEGSGMQPLEPLPGSSIVRARAVSDGGERIVGETGGGSTSTAVFWEPDGSIQVLQDVLEDQGVDLTGWRLTVANDISADGTVIVGHGINPDGNQEAFRAALAPLERPPIVVTALGDEPNDPIRQAADICDVDRTEQGRQCTLRAALELAGARSDPSTTIRFRLDGAGPHTIVVETPLPRIEKPIDLDGTTQPGYAGAPLVVVSGAGTGAGTNGLEVTDTGDGSRIAGLAVVGFGGVGVVIQTGNEISGDLSAPGVTVEDCWIGVLGNTAAGNQEGGLLVLAQNTRVLRNVISANGGKDGAFVLGFGSRVEGNYIGTNAAGTQALGNTGHGLTVQAIAVARDNLISGNGGYGLQMLASQSFYNGDTGLSWGGPALRTTKSGRTGPGPGPSPTRPVGCGSMGRSPDSTAATPSRATAAPGYGSPGRTTPCWGTGSGWGRAGPSPTRGRASWSSTRPRPCRSGATCSTRSPATGM